MTKQPIHNTLRMHRKQAGLRQREVAQALGLASSDRISRWEHGMAVPQLKNLFRLAALYRVMPKDLYPEVHQENPLSSSMTGAVSEPGIPVEE